MSDLRFLFIPVSSTQGIGEYMRSVILSSEIQKQWPKSDIRFVINRHAPYANHCPFRTYMLDSSPTKKVKEVNQIMENFTPDVVIFDASGRQAQLKKAKQVGAITIFISQHVKKRKRGMKFSRARYTDFHFVAQPEFAIPPISWWQSKKLHLAKLPQPEYIGAVFTPPDAKTTLGLLQTLGVKEKEYMLFSAGSGGHRIDDDYASDLFMKAAESIAQQFRLTPIVVMGANYPKSLPVSQSVKVIKSLPNADFMALLSQAKAFVSGGGSGILQAIALKIPTVACAIAKDQPPRIALCEDKGLLISTQPSEIDVKVAHLLSPETWSSVTASLSQQYQSNGTGIVIKRLKEQFSTMEY